MGHELDAVYAGAGDTRRVAHDSAESLEGEQAMVSAIKTPGLLTKARDGACHEMVMWYIHHLSDQAREEIRQRLVLPLLPEIQHDSPVAEVGSEEADVHQRYTAQAGC